MHFPYDCIKIYRDIPSDVIINKGQINLENDSIYYKQFIVPPSNLEKYFHPYFFSIQNSVSNEKITDINIYYKSILISSFQVNNLPKKSKDICLLNIDKHKYLLATKTFAISYMIDIDNNIPTIKSFDASFITKLLVKNKLIKIYNEYQQQLFFNCNLDDVSSYLQTYKIYVGFANKIIFTKNGCSDYIFIINLATKKFNRRKVKKPIAVIKCFGKWLAITTPTGHITLFDKNMNVHYEHDYKGGGFSCWYITSNFIMFIQSSLTSKYTINNTLFIHFYKLNILYVYNPVDSQKVVRNYLGYFKFKDVYPQNNRLIKYELSLFPTESWENFPV